MWLLLWVQAKLASESTGKHMHVRCGMCGEGDVTIFQGAARFHRTLSAAMAMWCRRKCLLCFREWRAWQQNVLSPQLSTARGGATVGGRFFNRCGVLPVCPASQPASQTLCACAVSTSHLAGFVPQNVGVQLSATGTTTHFAFAPMDTTPWAPRTSACSVSICLNATHMTQACVSCRAVDNRHCFGHSLCTVLHLGLRSAQSPTFVCACCVQYHWRAQYYASTAPCAVPILLLCAVHDESTQWCQ